LRERVREEGLLAPHLPPELRRGRPAPGRVRTAQRGAGLVAPRPLRLQLARLRTSATWSCCSITGARSRRIAFLPSPGRGLHPELLRDDRARPRRIEPRVAGRDRPRRRRPLRDRGDASGSRPGPTALPSRS
jgi:hypothetical protein